MRVVLLGPPGSGKGTHGQRLAGDVKAPIIATGEILRQAIHEGTALGKSAEDHVKSGRLVPDEVALGLIETSSWRPRGAGFILTGPRAHAGGRAEGLLGIGGWTGSSTGGESEAVVNWLLERWLCPQCAIYF
jgi:adenylate kinase